MPYRTDTRNPAIILSGTSIIFIATSVIKAMSVLGSTPATYRFMFLQFMEKKLIDN